MTVYLVSAADLASLCPVCRKARTVQGRDGDTEIIGCPAALDAVMGHGALDADYEHQHAAALARPVTLAAMASVPSWLSAQSRAGCRSGLASRATRDAGDGGVDQLLTVIEESGVWREVAP